MSTYLEKHRQAYDNWVDYYNNSAPIFGKEPTEHSSSLRGTEMDWLENEQEEEMMLLDEWESFEATMASERERVAESWVKGQWPDYEDSKEERDEMFR